MSTELVPNISPGAEKMRVPGLGQKVSAIVSGSLINHNGKLYDEVDVIITRMVFTMVFRSDGCSFHVAHA